MQGHLDEILPSACPSSEELLAGESQSPRLTLGMGAVVTNDKCILNDDRHVTRTTTKMQITYFAQLFRRRKIFKRMSAVTFSACEKRCHHSISFIDKM